MLPDYPTKVCNMCGKAFELWDHQEDFCFDRHIGYGSAHDFEHIQLNLCCQCFDIVMDWLLPRCKYNPILEKTNGLEAELNLILVKLGMDLLGYRLSFRWLKEVILYAVHHPNTWRESYLDLLCKVDGDIREFVRQSLYKAVWDQWNSASEDTLCTQFGHPIQTQFEGVKPNHIEFIALLSKQLREKYQIGSRKCADY